MGDIYINVLLLISCTDIANGNSVPSSFHRIEPSSVGLLKKGDLFTSILSIGIAITTSQLVKIIAIK